MSPAITSREKLIDGMRASLRARGYGGTSMKDLLTSTGVSSGSMYHSFPGGKEELAASAIREVGLHAAGLIRNVFDEAESVAEGLATIFGALANELEESNYQNGCPIGVPATEAVSVSELIQEASSEVFEAWAAAYRDALLSDGWADKEATRLATVIITSYEGSLAIARAMRNTAPIDDATAYLVAAVNLHAP